MEDVIEDIIKRLGKSFVGLWAYQVYNQVYSKKKIKGKKYCVTICYKGNHIDTGTCKTPKSALKQAIKLVNKLKKQ
jgi:hypothetical protein